MNKFLETVGFTFASAWPLVGWEEGKDEPQVHPDLCHWNKPKNSKSRACQFFADDAPYIHLSNRFSVHEGDQQNTGFFKHLENKVKPHAGKTKSQKRKIFLLGSSYPRTPGQWIWSVHLLIMLLRAWGSLVITLPS